MTRIVRVRARVCSAPPAGARPASSADQRRTATAPIRRSTRRGAAAADRRSPQRGEIAGEPRQRMARRLRSAHQTSSEQATTQPMPGGTRRTTPATERGGAHEASGPGRPDHSVRCEFSGVATLRRRSQRGSRLQWHSHTTIGRGRQSARMRNVATVKSIKDSVATGSVCVDDLDRTARPERQESEPPPRSGTRQRRARASTRASRRCGLEDSGGR